MSSRCLALLQGAVVTIYYWWQNIKGIEESSDKALRVMQITTIMVVILFVWGTYTVWLRGAQLPIHLPSRSHLHFSDDALGFLRGKRIADLRVTSKMLHGSRSLHSGHERLGKPGAGEPRNCTVQSLRI